MVVASWAANRPPHAQARSGLRRGPAAARAPAAAARAGPVPPRQQMGHRAAGDEPGHHQVSRPRRQARGQQRPGDQPERLRQADDGGRQAAPALRDAVGERRAQCGVHAVHAGVHHDPAGAHGDHRRLPRQRGERGRAERRADRDPGAPAPEPPRGAVRQQAREGRRDHGGDGGEPRHEAEREHLVRRVQRRHLGRQQDLHGPEQPDPHADRDEEERGQPQAGKRRTGPAGTSAANARAVLGDFIVSNGSTISRRPGELPHSPWNRGRAGAPQQFTVTCGRSLRSRAQERTKASGKPHTNAHHEPRIGETVNFRTVIDFGRHAGEDARTRSWCSLNERCG